MMFFGIIIVVVIVYLLIRGSGQLFPGTLRESSEDPLEILRRRFAEGAISEEEFNRIRKELNS